MLIDNRAGSRDLIHYPPLLTTSELTSLDSADALIVGNGPDSSPTLVGVEVKSMSDLLSSISTGRLQATQIPAMLDTYAVNWLLYYGQYRCGVSGELEILATRKRHPTAAPKWRQFKLGRRNVPYGYLESFLYDVAHIGFHIKHTPDIANAARWLGCLERWWLKPWSKHKGLRTLDNSRSVSLMPGMSPGVLLKTKVASALPGVGFERALAAARHFDTVADMIAADADEWASIDGIGKVVAKAVTRAVRDL